MALHSPLAMIVSTAVHIMRTVVSLHALHHVCRQLALQICCHHDETRLVVSPKAVFALRRVACTLCLECEAVLTAGVACCRHVCHHGSLGRTAPARNQGS